MNPEEPTIEETNILLWKKLQIATEALQKIKNGGEYESSGEPWSFTDTEKKIIASGALSRINAL